MLCNTCHTLSLRLAERARLRRLIAVFGFATTAFLSVSCTSISPRNLAEVPVLREPIFDTIVLDGLVVDDEREVGSSVQVGSNHDRSFTTSYSPGAMPSSTHTFVNSTVVNRSTDYERFQSFEVQDAVRFLMEDSRVARRIVDEETRVRIEGRRLEFGGETGVGKIVWNVLNTFGPGLIGLPYVGTSGATVELRVYVDDEFVERYVGHGQATWRTPAWGVLPRLGRIRLSAANVATRAAAQAAVAKLVAAPPHIPAESLAAGE